MSIVILGFRLARAREAGGWPRWRRPVTSACPKAGSCTRGWCPSGERLNACYRRRQEAALAAYPGRRRPRNVPGVDIPAVGIPAELAGARTVGIIYDEIDGLNFYNE
jgi:hypothetical protein